MHVHEPVVAPMRQSRQQPVVLHRLIVGRRCDVLCHSRRVDFAVDVSQRDACTVVTASGELDVHTAPALKGQLDALSQVPNPCLIVDLGDVGFIDSTGLGVLVSTLKHVRESGGSLDVVVASPRVLRVFALTGLDVVIPLHATLDGALAGR